MLQTYYKNAYALIRPACPACFVAISPRVNEEVRMRMPITLRGFSYCWKAVRALLNIPSHAVNLSNLHRTEAAELQS